MRTLALLLLASPLFGAAGTTSLQATSTERVNLARGAVIRVNNSYGAVTVEGWDQPEIEVTVVKSLPLDFNPKHAEQAARRLDGVRIVTERRSDTELEITTISPRRAGVAVDYQIHVPRDSRVTIHHGTGSVFVSDVTGDIEASCGRGDIVLMLPASGAYAIDAKSKFGLVTSDFEGDTHVRRYRLGERYVSANTPSSHQIRLRVGFGGITIKPVPSEAYAPANR